MRISDWSSDVCSSDLIGQARFDHHAIGALVEIEFDLAQRFLPVGGIHLIGLLVALQQPAAADRVAERAVEAARIFGRIGHDLDVDMAFTLQRVTDQIAEERRVGKKCVSAGITRGSPEDKKKKKKQ